MSPRNTTRPEDLLLRKAEIYKERLEEKKTNIKNQEMKECVFKPKISDKKHTSTDRSKSIHEELFKEAGIRKEKKHVLEEISLKQFTFVPEIISTSGKQESKDQFVDRLMNTKKKFHEEMENIRQNQFVTHDESTGQRLFKPQTYSKIEVILNIAKPRNSDLGPFILFERCKE